MARFYFHLSAPDEYFYDSIGYDVSDLAVAHAVAIRFAGRVVRFVPFFLNHALDIRHWTVEVTDESQQRVMTVMFPANPRKTLTERFARGDK